MSIRGGTVELNDVQIDGNKATTPFGSGVGLRIDEEASVVFSGGQLVDNEGSFGSAAVSTIRGAGIHVIGSDLSLSNLSIQDNRIHSTGLGGLADGAGLNIFGADSASVVSVLDCTFERNEATTEDVDTNPSTKQGAAGGGGLTATNAAGVLLSIVIQRSAFINNITRGDSSSGAGIRVFGGADDGSLTLTAINTTISGNTTDGLGSAQGAGVLQGNSNVEFRHLTIVNNQFLPSSIQVGNGLFATSGTLTLENTIVSANVGFSSDCSASAAGNLIFDSATIVSDVTDCLFTGTPREINPQLEELADNGGPTMTHALQALSPALETGTAAGCVGFDGAALTVDQRGELRNGVCDVGAFEDQN